MTLRKTGRKDLNKEGSTDFLIRIIFCKNVNWQGEVHWLETDKKRRFRSSLEMINLMQEAINEAGRPSADYTFRSWKKNSNELINKAKTELLLF